MAKTSAKIGMHAFILLAHTFKISLFSSQVTDKLLSYVLVYWCCGVLGFSLLFENSLNHVH